MPDPMIPPLLLQWFHDGAWHQVGVAVDPASRRDLVEHGRRLAACGGRYRLVNPACTAGGADHVVHTYPEAVFA